MVMTGFATTILDTYNSVVGLLPLWAQDFVNFFLLVVLIILYSTIVWKFYKFIAKKNPLGLNLNEKYNPSTHTFFTRFIAGMIYLVEYALILPFLIFVIFSVFTLFLIILSQSENIAQILIISATVIASIRITAYYKEELSQEIAKILPFMLLAVAVLNPATFIQGQYFSKIIQHLNDLPNFINQIGGYLIFIIIIEILLMFFDTIFSLLGINDNDEVEDKK